MSKLRINNATAAAFRAKRGFLVARAAGHQIEQVVSGVGGVQAQVQSAAELAIGARVDSVDRSAIQKALYHEKTLVRTWSLRGTLHLHSSDDLPVYLSSMSPGITDREQRWLRSKGLDSRKTAALLGAVEEALSAGPLSRQELADQMAKALGDGVRPLVEHSWGGIMKLACLKGMACFGPPRGRESTFASCAEWLPSMSKVPHEDALAQLLRKYLTAHGPARIQDFAHWTGLTVRACTSTLQQITREIEEVEVQGQPSLVMRDDLDALAATEPLRGAAFLLPAFDVMLLTHRNKEHLVGDEHYKQVYAAGGWIRPTVVTEGRISGTWTHSIKSNYVLITIEPFCALRPSLRETLQQRAKTLAPFFAKEIKVQWTEPDADETPGASR